MEYVINDGILTGIRYEDGEINDESKIYSIPEGVTEIAHISGNGYILGCKEIALPSTLEKIDIRAFNRIHNNVASVSVADGNQFYKTVGKCLIDKRRMLLVKAFNGADIPQDYGVREIGEEAFIFNDSVKQLVLPESVISIEDSAFFGSEIQRLVIPKSVSHIGDGAFGLCLQLREITVDPDNANYYSKNNCLISKSDQTLIAAANRDAVIPKGVKSIERWVFSRFGHCGKAVIPASVKLIGEHNFEDCGDCGFDDAFHPEAITKPCVIISQKDSIAAKYAKEYGLPFEIAEEEKNYYPRSNKKLSILYILNVLREYSDADSPMTHAMIAERVMRDYGLELERKSISNSIKSLDYLGYEIRSVPKKGVYYVSEFTDGEIRFLIDNILFSKHISAAEAKEIVGKIKGLGNNHSNAFAGVPNVNAAYHTPAKNTLYTVEIISEAIKKHKRISFIYNEYGLDKALHPVSEEPLKVNPIRLEMSNGFYYLIGTADSGDEPDRYRIDKISCIEIAGFTDNTSGGTFRSPAVSSRDRASSRSYTPGGKAEFVKLRIDKSIIGQVIDKFGDDFRIVNEGDVYAVIYVKSPFEEMFRWALEHADKAVVLSPAELKERILFMANKMSEQYLQNG